MDDPLSLALSGFWRRHGAFFPAGAEWLAGCSGGSDSVALLHAAASLARRTGSRLAGVHLHHGLRGADADLDLETARRVCQGCGTPFLAFRSDVAGLARRWRVGMEEAGRRARRALWTVLAGAAVAAGRPPPLVWLAHHAGDQAETVLFRLRRGTARRGCAGLRPVRPFGTWPTEWGHPGALFAPDGLAGNALVSVPESREQGEATFMALRPWLAVDKAAIIQYALKNGLAWRDDVSNRDLRHARNRLRHDTLPRLEARTPNLRNRLLAVARSAAAREEDEAAWAAGWVARNGHFPLPRGEGNGGGGLAFAAAGPWRGAPWTGRAGALEDGKPPPLPPSPSRRRMILREFLERATGRTLSRRVTLEALDRLAGDGRQGRRLSLPGGWQARRAAWGLAIADSAAPPALPDGGTLEVGRPPETAFGAAASDGGLLRLRLSPWPGPRADRDGGDRREAWIAREAIVWPLTVRRRRPGDVFRPLGGPGKRKVKDFLADRRLAPGDRDRVRVVADQAGILWLAPLRQDERSRVARPGDLAWRLRWEWEGG